jgi:diguanylate cyclase (GGDEF)-like protein/PAS domain S-box-containing protein
VHRDIFQALMNSSDCPVLIIERSHSGQVLRYANAPLKRLLGCETEDLTAREWSSLFAGGMESGLSRARLAIDSGMPVNETLRTERVSGEDLWLDARLYPIRDPTGSTVEYVGILHDVTNEHRSHAELQHRVHHDALTGLANRHLLQERFEQARAHAQRSSGSIAVVVLDMNGFKSINDRFGHPAGDDLLRCVAGRLEATVRAEDAVARLGGDEFVLLLGEEAADVNAARKVIARVAEALTRPIRLLRHQLVLACCAGVSRYPQDGADLETLLNAADAALYRAKARAKIPARAAPPGSERQFLPFVA